VNRREFAIAATGVLATYWQGAQAYSQPPSGITNVTRNKLVLTVPPDPPRVGSLRYALSFPFQAGPHTVGLMVSRMIEQTLNYGFLDGSDIVLLDQLESPGNERIFAASRNEIVASTVRTSGRLFLKSPMIGGFVPQGALRLDGSPHPHGGTGFGVGQGQWFSFTDGRFHWHDPSRRDMNEVYQLSYDGKSFSSHRSEVRAQNEDDPLRIGDTGWAILVTGIRNAIPDGDDLLLATMATRLDRTAVSVGVVRWTRRDGHWRPVGFDPVALTERPIPQGANFMEKCPWQEPSVARDADGSLLFSARGADAPAPFGYTLRAWRSSKVGEWMQILDAPRARLNSPVTINVAANGAAYFVSNPYDPAFIPETQENGRGREKLAVWALSADRSRISSPVLIRDCLEDFGKPSSAEGDKWMADHPNGMTVRFSDGAWRHVLCYRVCHSPRFQSSAMMPSPHSGSYVEEVHASGHTASPWRFADS
jgi:hypothetical protein